MPSNPTHPAAPHACPQRFAMRWAVVPIATARSATGAVAGRPTGGRATGRALHGFGQLRAGAHGSPRASQLVQHWCSGLRSEQPHYARAVSLIRTRPRTTGGDWSPICIRSRKQSGTELGVRADEDVTDRNSTTRDRPCGAMPTTARPSPSAACWRSRRTEACLLVDAGWPPQSAAG